MKTLKRYKKKILDRRNNFPNNLYFYFLLKGPGTAVVAFFFFFKERFTMGIVKLPIVKHSILSNADDFLNIKIDNFFNAFES